VRNLFQVLPNLPSTFLHLWWGGNPSKVSSSSGIRELSNTHQNKNFGGKAETMSLPRGGDLTPLAYEEIFQKFNKKKGKSS